MPLKSSLGPLWRNLERGQGDNRWRISGERAAVEDEESCWVKRERASTTRGREYERHWETGAGSVGPYSKFCSVSDRQGMPTTGI